MRYCTRCVYPANHPLHLTFDKEGVCSGCRIHEEKDKLDWDERREKLRTLLKSFRSSSRMTYDCVVPVSGARDSYFIVHTVKHEFGLNPLLVTYNKHYNTRIGIRNLAYLRTLMGCDLLTLTVSPTTVKKLTRVTIKKLGSIYWHCLAGQSVFPVHTAVRLKIPLIIFGVHQGCDQVGMFSHTDEVEMTRKYRKEHDLMGVEAEDLVGEDGLTQQDLQPFLYPHDKEVESVGVRGIYLSNYLRWDSKAQHERMIKQYGYETTQQRRTFDAYNDVDCFHYSDLHDWIKFCKWGYGKANDHASREIRLKRLTRTEGIELVKRYQHVSPDPKRFSLFLDWIGLTEREFTAVIDAHRDPRIWTKDRLGRWKLKDSVINHRSNPGVKAASLATRGPCTFVVTPSKAPSEKEDRYILIGKGFVT